MIQRRTNKIPHWVNGKQNIVYELNFQIGMHALEEWPLSFNPFRPFQNRKFLAISVREWVKELASLMPTDIQMQIIYFELKKFQDCIVQQWPLKMGPTHFHTCHVRKQYKISLLSIKELQSMLKTLKVENKTIPLNFQN